MSTDYDVGCVKCKKYVHLGQRMGGHQFSIGHGSNDKEGWNNVGDFIDDHIHCNALQIKLADTLGPEFMFGKDFACVTDAYFDRAKNKGDDDALEAWFLNHDDPLFEKLQEAETLDDALAFVRGLNDATWVARHDDVVLRVVSKIRAERV